MNETEIENLMKIMNEKIIYIYESNETNEPEFCKIPNNLTRKL